MNGLGFWDFFNLIGIVYRVTGKWIFDGHFEGEDWAKLMSDPEFIAFMKKLFGGE